MLTPKGEAVDNPELVTGEWVMRCEARTLDDIRALGGNDLADERKFEAAARLSEINLSLYRAYARPVVRALTNPHDRRGDATPAPAAPLLRDVRRAATRSSPGSRVPPTGFAKTVARRIPTTRCWRCRSRCRGRSSTGSMPGARARSASPRRPFTRSTATPALQAALGIDTASSRPPRKAARSKLHQALVARRIGELKAEMTRGGLAEAVVRALIYVGLARGVVDERGFAAIRGIRGTLPPAHQRTLAEFKALVRDQFLMLIVDEETAVLAIPHLLPESIEERREAFGVLRQVLEAPGALPEEAAARLQEVAALFGLGPELITLARGARARARRRRADRFGGQDRQGQGEVLMRGSPRSGCMKTAIKAEAAAGMIGEGAVLLVGGFMAVGSPLRLIDAILKRGVGGLTVVCNDLAMPDKGVGKLVVAGQVKRAIVSHIGLNPVAQKKMMAGELEIELVPQGTLVERIRAGGYGLGGVLTATGLGTPVEEGKQIIEVDGRPFILEKPIRGDFALIACHHADYVGNLGYVLTAHNFNPIMALAGEVVIAEAEHIVPVGMIPPDVVKTPGVVVDYLLGRAA